MPNTLTDTQVAINKIQDRLTTINNGLFDEHYNQRWHNASNAKQKQYEAEKTELESLLLQLRGTI